ncbi:hypothetical protein [Halobacteriovorax marinus]|uniref:hypothetical protein n=1 Tax=Halobacteriovorax marinus TaxID=97084 RepID=UPI003A8F1C48
MKSTFFRKPLEFALEIEGENWKQGDPVNGSISISNHSNEEVDFSKFSIYLCNGDLKKIQKGDVKGLVVVDEVVLEGSDTSFSFKLDENSPISEKSSGPYLVCAKKDQLLEGDLMALRVGPSKIISEILEVLENFMRFKVKSLKSKKNSLEAQITLPSTKEYSSIANFKLSFATSGSDIELNYLFKVKKVSFDGGVAQTKDETKKFKTLLTSKEYLIYGDSLNQDAITSSVQKTSDEVKLKPII